MNDDTVHINGKPATDAQLRKLTGLDKETDLTQRVAEVVNLNWTAPDAEGFQHLAHCELWERHVAERANRTVVTLNPFFWSEDDPEEDKTTEVRMDWTKPNDPKDDFPCWTDNDPDEWMNDRRDEATAEWATFIEAGRA
jgi:hypothetical protein